MRNNEPHNFVRVKLQTKTLLIMYFSPGSIAAFEGIFRQSIGHCTNSEFLNLNLSIFALRGLNVAVETILNADTAQKHYFGGCLLICKYSSLIRDSSRQSKSRTGSSNEYIFSQVQRSVRRLSNERKQKRDKYTAYFRRCRHVSFLE